MSLIIDDDMQRVAGFRRALGSHAATHRVELSSYGEIVK